MKKEEIIDTIKQFACSLAEKELVDKYGKLPEQLMTKGGHIVQNIKMNLISYTIGMNIGLSVYRERMQMNCSYANNYVMCRKQSSGTYFPAPERAEAGRRPHLHRHRNYHSKTSINEIYQNFPECGVFHRYGFFP